MDHNPAAGDDDRAALAAAKDRAHREHNRLVAYLSRIYPSHLARHPSEDADWEDDWRTIVCMHARRLRGQVRQAARARPYYLHSPRLLSVGNLERWPVRRKLLAYALLQEVRARGARRGGGRTGGRRDDGRAYVGCNGARGQGYRVVTWLAKARADRRPGLGPFIDDLAALRQTLGLRLELRGGGRKAGDETVWDDEALAVLEAYRRTPALAGDLRLKISLPADLEAQLQARLAAAGIEAVGAGEDDAWLLQALSPRQPAPAALRRMFARSWSGAPRAGARPCIRSRAG